MTGELFTNKLFNYSKLELLNTFNWTNSNKRESILDFDDFYNDEDESPPNRILQTEVRLYIRLLYHRFSKRLYMQLC